MNAHRVILVTQRRSGTRAAADLLTGWALHGLIHPFISHEGDGRAVYVSKRGISEPSSVFEILGSQELEVIRVAALAGPHIDEASGLQARTRMIVDQIRDDLAPDGLKVVEVRIWAPPDPRPKGAWSAPTDLFSSAADANLVLVPEDRQTENKVGIPLSRTDDGSYGSHVAAELATALGMWSTMPGAPVDVMQAGTIGFGEPKVHLVRSFVRVAEIPVVSLAGAADHGGVLRVPPGCQEAPYPLEILAYTQERIGQLLDRELVRSATSRRAEWVGMRRFMREVGRGIVSSMRYMFTMSADVVDGLRDMAGRVMQDAVGTDSVLRLIWRGKPSEVKEGDRTLDVEELIATIRRRRALKGGVRINQELWSDVGKAVFSLTDGGDMPEGVPPPKIENRVVMIKEVGMIAPPYGPDLASSIREDASEAASSTLLGRLGAHLRRAEERSRLEFDRLVELSKGLFQLDQPPALTLAGVVTSALVVLIVTGLVILSGLVELVGITGMSAMTRAWLWGGITAVYGLGLWMVSRAVRARFATKEPEQVPTAVSAMESGGESVGEQGAKTGPDRAGHRSTGPTKEQPTGNRHKQRPPPASSVLQGVTTFASVAGVIAFAVALTVRKSFAWDDVALGITIALTLYAIGLAVRLDRKPYRSLETFRQVRLLFFFTVIYGAFALVGSLARAYGWYGNRQLEGFGNLWIGLVLLIVFTLILLLAMAFDGYRRDNRARTRVSDLERAIVAAVDTQWATEEAFEQFVGSASAWAAVMWKPFGEFVPGEGGTRDEFTFEVLKAETRPFLVTPLGAIAMRERMMKELAKPGWLSRRYQTAVEAYRRRRAIETGTEPGTILLPDQDPREVHTVAPEHRSKVSGRWRFLSDLTEGIYHKELSRALDALDHANAAEWVYQQEGTLAASETGGESLEQYLGAVVPQRQPKVSHVYLVADARPAADRSWRPTLWWPSAVLNRPDGQPVQECHVRSVVNGDLVIMSVRHDSVGPYTPADLFEPAQDSNRREEDTDSADEDIPAPVL